jgi:hypothetical protein
MDVRHPRHPFFGEMTKWDDDHQQSQMIIDHHRWSTFITTTGWSIIIYFLKFYIILWSKSDITYDQYIVNQESWMTFQWRFNGHHPTFSGMAMDGHKNEVISRKSCWSGSDRSCLTTWCQRSGNPGNPEMAVTQDTGPGVFQWSWENRTCD